MDLVALRLKYTRCHKHEIQQYRPPRRPTCQDPHFPMQSEHVHPQGALRTVHCLRRRYFDRRVQQRGCEHLLEQKTREHRQKESWKSYGWKLLLLQQQRTRSCPNLGNRWRLQSSPGILQLPSQQQEESGRRWGYIRIPRLPFGELLAPSFAASSCAKRRGLPEPERQQQRQE